MNQFDILNIFEIKLLKEVKAACISIEAKKTLIIDKEETLKLANEAGIAIVAS